MNTKKNPLTMTVLTVALLLGCQDGDPAGPELQDLALEDQLALELLADPATTETALELAQVQTSAAQRRGWAWGSHQNHQSRAEECFRQAEAALGRGDQIRAMEKAREGRQLVAEAIAMAGGSQAIRAMVERLEALPVQVSADPDLFTNAGKLGLQLGQIAERAREAIRAGDQIRAGALGVLAEQAFRHNHRHQHQHQYQAGAFGAEVAVELGAEAVELATRLLAEQALAMEESQDFLTAAEEFLAQAILALEAGEEARAIHLAHLAQWWALKAVVLPGGITDEEARMILGLAETLLESATAAVGPEPTELQAALLARAGRMLERGKEAIENGACRGMGALWQSAVISSYLIG